MSAKIFIASSVEGLEIARAIQNNLHHDFEIKIWSQGVFKLSDYPLESLLETLEEHDFGIFVFSPDDEKVLRNESVKTIRDNVIYELGLFTGRYGRKQSFIVMPSDVDLDIPSDLVGLTPAKYSTGRSDGNWDAALGPACNQIRKQVKEQYQFEYPREGIYGHNLLNKEVIEVEQGDYSFRANLKTGQNLKVRISIEDKELNSCPWSFSIAQVGDWHPLKYYEENFERSLILKGASDSDLNLKVNDSCDMKIEYFENSHEPTFQKTVQVRSA